MVAYSAVRWADKLVDWTDELVWWWAALKVVLTVVMWEILSVGVKVDLSGLVKAYLTAVAMVAEMVDLCRNKKVTENGGFVMII